MEFPQGHIIEYNEEKINDFRQMIISLIQNVEYHEPP